jgi:hypothetical protein
VYSKITLIQTFIKNFLNSIMMIVLQSVKASNNGVSKQQDEFAYFKMVETIIKYSLQE